MIGVRSRVAMVLILMLPLGHGFAQEPHGHTSLEVRLEIGKTGLALGEPVYATVRLINIGAAPVTVAKVLDPQMGVVQIHVSGPNKPRSTFLPLFTPMRLVLTRPWHQAERSPPPSDLLRVAWLDL